MHIFCTFSECCVQGLVENPSFVHHFEQPCSQSLFGLIHVAFVILFNNFDVVLHCQSGTFTVYQFFDLVFVNFVEQHCHQSFTLVFFFHVHQNVFDQLTKYFLDDLNSWDIWQLFLQELNIVSFFPDDWYDSPWGVVENFLHLSVWIVWRSLFIIRIIIWMIVIIQLKGWQRAVPTDLKSQR